MDVFIRDGGPALQGKTLARAGRGLPTSYGAGSIPNFYTLDKKKL